MLCGKKNNSINKHYPSTEIMTLNISLNNRST